MPDGNERGGAEATINIFGGGAVNLLPGQLVTLTIHDRPTPVARGRGAAMKGYMEGKAIEREDEGRLRPPCVTGCRSECKTCGRTKAPVGRSIAPAMAGGVCDFDCPGYYENPKPCDLWPGESRVAMPEGEEG
jgi:hypothetical protein